MQPRSAPSRRYLDPGGRDQGRERLRGIALVKGATAAVDQERGRFRLGKRLVAEMLIATQSGGRGRVQEDLPGLAELGVGDHERAGLQVNVTSSEAAAFALPHAGHRQQPDQRPPGRRPHHRFKAARRVHQRGDVLRRVEVGRDPPVTAGQHILGRDLRGGIPSARRMTRYSSAWVRSALTVPLPATAVPADATRPGRSWHIPMWTAGCDGGAPGRSRAATRRPAASLSPASAGAGARRVVPALRGRRPGP